MLVSMLKIEQTKLFRRKALWIELALVASLIVLLFGVILIIQGSNEIPDSEKALISSTLSWPNGIKVALAVSSNQMLGALLIIVLVSMVVAQEYTWQTYTLAVRAGAPRFTVVISKFVILIVTVFLIVMTALVVGTVMTGLLTVATGGQIDLSRYTIGDALFSMLTTAYSLLPYLALTFLIAVITRSLPASIGVAIGYVFIVEGILPGLLMFLGGLPGQIGMMMPGQLASVLVNANGQSAALQSLGESAAPPVPYGVDPIVAVVGIGLYTVIFLAVAVIQFQKQDLTS